MMSGIKRRKFGDGNSVKVDRLIGFKLSAASTKSATTSQRVFQIASNTLLGEHEQQGLKLLRLPGFSPSK